MAACSVAGEEAAGDEPREMLAGRRGSDARSSGEDARRKRAFVHDRQHERRACGLGQERCGCGGVGVASQATAAVSGASDPSSPKTSA